MEIGDGVGCTVGNCGGGIEQLEHLLEHLFPGPNELYTIYFKPAGRYADGETVF